MAQAPLEHGFSFDLLSLFQDFLIAPKVDVSGRQVAQALVVALVIVIVDEDRKRKLVTDIPVPLGLLAGLCRGLSVRD